MKKDLVASTQDGESVNKKYIRNLDAIDQYCLNHGLHLGVCDKLYKKKHDIEGLSGACDNDYNQNDSFDKGTNFEVISDECEDDIDYNDLLKNLHKLIKYIKLSSVRN